MRNSQRSQIGLALALGLFPTACLHRSFQVIVPHGYIGQVHITCEMSDDLPPSPVLVDQSGNGISGRCPRGGARLTVTRDGAQVPPANVKWTTTGDGFATGVAFSVN